VALRSKELEVLRWYFDRFAYDIYDGIGNTDWLSRWKASADNELQLTGMGKLQKIKEGNKRGVVRISSGSEGLRIIRSEAKWKV
jgi:hypothetical protein